MWGKHIYIPVCTLLYLYQISPLLVCLLVESQVHLLTEMRKNIIMLIFIFSQTTNFWEKKTKQKNMGLKISIYIYVIKMKLEIRK